MPGRKQRGRFSCRERSTRLLRRTLSGVLAGNIFSISARRETLPEWQQRKAIPERSHRKGCIVR
eukprot:2250835-Lingulodinium_polyedra.AAC.1